MLALLRRASFLTTFYGLYFIQWHTLQTTNFLLGLWEQLPCTVVRLFRYMYIHITIQRHSIFRVPTVEFNPWKQRKDCYQYTTLPPSHHGWMKTHSKTCVPQTNLHLNPVQYAAQYFKMALWYRMFTIFRLMENKHYDVFVSYLHQTKACNFVWKATIAQISFVKNTPKGCKNRKTISPAGFLSDFPMLQLYRVPAFLQDYPL